jgi:adenine-specific DNA-methyltransferase
MSFSELSITLSKEINKADKQKDGIYFTPPKTIESNLKLLSKHFSKIKTVLEPSCGSCEYVNAIHSKYPTLDITAIEFNTHIYDSIKDLNNDNISIQHADFLSTSEENKYDLIIGNPPYFVMKKSNVDNEYHDYFDGRPNIFILFIIKSLKMLNKNGIISFILPKNFLNCLYYNKTREYIFNSFKILNIVNCTDDFIDTKQHTIIMNIQNKTDVKNNNKFAIKNGEYIIFGEPNNIKTLQKLYKNSKNLYELGFCVNVGTVVWNQCKDILTDNKEDTTLIYSSDIRDNKLELQSYTNKQKKNYILKEGTNEPLLVVNRGYGKGDYKFNYLLIEGGFEYLIENHLICIKYQNTIENQPLIEMYKKIIISLNDERTKEFIDIYFGNSAINTTELCHILPIYGL